LNNSVCIDASLALTWLLPREKTEATDALIPLWHYKGTKLITAPLFHAEVTSAIRREVYFKKLNTNEGDLVFFLYLQLDIETVDDPEIYTLAWELAKKFNLPRTYDIQYLAVAELKDCELWTADRRLANSLRGKSPRIKLADTHSPGR